MLISEMHIALDQELNKINSALYDILTPYEKDFALNKNIERFVKQRYGAASNIKRKGFEMSQKRIDDLRSLVQTNYFVNAYVPISLDPDSSISVEAEFPSDYMFLLNQRSKISYNPCGTFVPVTEGFTEEYSLLDISALNFTNWGDFVLYYYINPTLTIVYSNPEASAYTRADDSIMIGILIDHIKNVWQTTLWNTKYDIEVYYEKYDTKFFPNQLIFVYKGIGVAPVWNVSDDGGVNTQGLVLGNNSKSKYTITNTITVANRAVQQDDLFALQQDPFGATTFDFPLSIINDNKIRIYFDNTFVVNQTIMSYLRKPKTVSYYLSINCNLPEETHDEIVSMTASYLLEEFEAGRLKTHLETTVATNE